MSHGESMTLNALLHWLKETPLSQAISESDWLFPSIESLHVIAITLVVGSIAVVDLRLLGVASRNRSAAAVTHAVVPLTWVAFVIAAATGLALFIAKPVTYGHNSFFLFKMALIVLAGVNMAAFHAFVQKRLDQLPAAAAPRWSLAQTSGLASLILWTAVVACGRWIGFTI